MSDPTHQSAAPDDGWTEVGVSDEFPEGAGWPVSACGTTIAIIRFEGRSLACMISVRTALHSCHPDG